MPSPYSFVGTKMELISNPLNLTDRIIYATAKHYGITVEEMKQTTRQAKFCRPRQVAIYLLRNISKLSVLEIGKMFGIDHSTVSHNAQAVKNRIDTESDFLIKLQEIKSKI